MPSFKLELNIMSEDHPGKATYIAHHCTVMKPAATLSADVCWEVDVPSLPKKMEIFCYFESGLQHLRQVQACQSKGTSHDHDSAFERKA